MHALSTVSAFMRACRRACRPQCTAILLLNGSVTALCKHSPGPTMMTGTEASAGSLKLLARGRTQPSSRPPGGVAAMLAEAAPLCTRPARWRVAVPATQ
jgi:hypothetical protein